MVNGPRFIPNQRGMDLVGEEGRMVGQQVLGQQSTLKHGSEMQWADQKKMSLEKATQIVGYSPLLYKGKK